MNVFILDDEQDARDNLKAHIKESGFETTALIEADSISQAKQLLDDYDPDIAFLDIRLGDGTSFDLLNDGFLLDRTKILFVSGHDEYAIKAFRYNAVDYILKPLVLEDLKSAMDKVQEYTSSLHKEQVQNLISNITNPNSELKKLVLKDHQMIRIVSINEIIYCQSDNNYTIFHLEDGTDITISKTLKEYEGLLKSNRFFRSHRSYLINLDHFKIYHRKKAGVIEMTDSSKIPLAESKREILFHLLDQL